MSNSDSNQEMTMEREQLDRGESTEQQAEMTAEEVEIRRNEQVDTNVELVDNLLLQAIKVGLLSGEQVENFNLPERPDTIRGMRAEVTTVNEAIDAASATATDAEIMELQSHRAQLITELLYAVTALIETEIDTFIRKLNAKIRIANETKKTEEVAQNIQDAKVLVPQWEALVSNSHELMIFFRDAYKDSVSDEFLGTLNSALYTETNKNKNNLRTREEVSGSGTLLVVMREVESDFHAIMDVEVPENFEEGEEIEEIEIKEDPSDEVEVEENQTLHLEL